jgi:transposase
MKTTYFLGIDVGKEKFHGALTVDGINYFDEEVDNNTGSIKAFFKQLKAKFCLDAKEQLIVCLEHTGVYSYLLLQYFTKAQIRVCVEPALRIKQSQGMQRGKNDKVDATRIAKYLFKNHEELKFWQPKREVIKKLQAFLALRDRYIKAKNQFEVPIKENTAFLQKAIGQMITAYSKKAIQAMKKGIERVDAEIAALIKTDSKLSTQMKLATSVTGVGPIIAGHMIVTTNEFQDITNHKKYACYSGVAPFPHQSGKSIKRKDQVSHLANKKIKTVLHMGARSAIQHSPEIKHFYERKLAEGKAEFSVLNAVCNKLISRVFVCIKEQRIYRKDYQNALA